MTIISNGPNLSPIISYFRRESYFGGTILTLIEGVIDGVPISPALTFGLEFELVWMNPSHILSKALVLQGSSPTTFSCIILYFVEDWIGIVVNAMLYGELLSCVIIIARLYAMYQRSRKILILFTLTFLAIRIASGVIAVITNIEYTSGVWIVVKHFHEVQRPSTGWSVGDCFTVLVKTHVFYFASSTPVLLFLPFSSATSLQSSLYANLLLEFRGRGDFLQLARAVQMSILGPRLIFAVREYHANLIAKSDGGAGMISVASRSVYTYQLEVFRVSYICTSQRQTQLE
ncbi:hypothetical protein K503DRAFT_780973 [Rhizopogon vinicolor AM-OR11-026]|uniref:Uncharacterized protein n=1 Tax=Rhizopogon vinicolor AM-OR11-026 TaxID=1314800 RepID=A0A1B7N885_9AGAM|nr:hypothetical protein K503DRAFT_780973 [Rhizopogon vinicolor AM-OR11-026]